MIEPALSAEEWQDDPRAIEVGWRIGGDRYVVAYEKLEGEGGDTGVSLCYPHGTSIAGTWIPPEKVPAIAALCLYGRISWEMVDALRWAIEASDDEWGHRPEKRLKLERATVATDILESLLPPREKP